MVVGMWSSSWLSVREAFVFHLYRLVYVAFD